MGEADEELMSVQIPHMHQQHPMQVQLRWRAVSTIGARACGDKMWEVGLDVGHTARSAPRQHPRVSTLLVWINKRCKAHHAQLQVNNVHSESAVKEVKGKCT